MIKGVVEAQAKVKNEKRAEVFCPICSDSCRPNCNWYFKARAHNPTKDTEFGRVLLRLRAKRGREMITRYTKPIARKRKRGRQPEATVKAAIIKYLTLNGYLVIPTPVRAAYNDVAGRYIPPPKSQRGMADLWACKAIYGEDTVIPRAAETVWIETKATKGQSDDQIEFQRKVKAAGCIYLIAKSIDDVVEMFPPREKRRRV